MSHFFRIIIWFIMLLITDCSPLTLIFMSRMSGHSVLTQTNWSSNLCLKSLNFIPWVMSHDITTMFYQVNIAMMAAAVTRTRPVSASPTNTGIKRRGKCSITLSQCGLWSFVFWCFINHYVSMVSCLYLVICKPAYMIKVNYLYRVFHKPLYVSMVNYLYLVFCDYGLLSSLSGVSSPSLSPVFVE